MQLAASCLWVLLMLIFFQCIFTLTAHAIPIDNGVVGDPKIECTGDQVGISFTTEKAFAGRVFVKGFASQKECSVIAAGITDKPPAINLSFTQCGVQRSRQLSPPGMAIYTTVVISFHPIFVTKVDRAYRISCFYMESGKTVTADLDVSMLTTNAITSSPVMPECRYEILTGGVNGTPAKYAKVGERVYHKWSCESKDTTYCMRVHSCVVDDGQGGESYSVVDRQGCATDRYILQNLEYPADLVAGQEAHVVKFADKASLYFSCQIELLAKTQESTNCIFARPNCTEPSGDLLASGGRTVAPAAPASGAELRRRVVRESDMENLTQDILNLNTSETQPQPVPGKNFTVVGDLDLLRQQLLVFDLDDGQGGRQLEPQAFVYENLSASDDASFSTSHNQLSNSRTLYEKDDKSVCVSPLGFGFIVTGFVAIFAVSFMALLRYMAPKNSDRFTTTQMANSTYSHNVPQSYRYNLPYNTMSSYKS